MDFGNETVLKATGITKKYGAAKALDKVSIEIKPIIVLIKVDLPAPFSPIKP